MAFALQLALLHDTLADSATTFEELSNEFGLDIAEGVAALTKNEHLPKPERMPDSLKRIRLLSKEVSAVKLADRITNVQEPPGHWDNTKKNSFAVPITKQRLLPGICTKRTLIPLSIFTGSKKKFTNKLLT